MFSLQFTIRTIAPLFTRCAQFLGPLVTENMTAKMRYIRVVRDDILVDRAERLCRLERAKGVRVFGLAYQEFGPWALCDQPATSNQKIDDVAKKAIASGFAQMGIASAARAMGKQDRLIAGMEATDAAEVREIRHLLEKHAAFEAIREFFFCLTKSIAVLSSRHPQEVPPTISLRLIRARSHCTPPSGKLFTKTQTES